MTSFPNQGLGHVQICHMTAVLCGNAYHGAIFTATGMGITGFCTLRMLGRLATPEHFSSECTAVHSPKCCWEDVIIL